ncbi:MAG: hypothetical protein LBB93_04435 [Elusimicrobiota bacterium]|jgi:hypothetical protein|nr:hypothetical protein [Elusimicrobiota bacterium]
MKIKSGAKKFCLLILCCGTIGLSNIFFHSPIELTNLLAAPQTASSSSAPVISPAQQGFSIVWPSFRPFIEPLYGFAFYALTLERTFYRPVLISWAVWTLLLVFLFCLLTKKTDIQTLIRLFYGLFLFASLIAFVVLFPLAGPKLVKPVGYISVDFHSHTRFSYDNSSTESSSLRFHEQSGYDDFFITEHQNTNSFSRFEEMGATNVFCGMQIQSSEGGVSVLLLSPGYFDGQLYQNLPLDEIIKKAHENGMLAVMPHWWKWHRYSFSELHASGIDGFEIYNNGYRNFDEAERQGLIDFSKENNLLMIASTDWHGWGYMTDAWTVLKTDKFNFDDISKYAASEEILLYRQEQSRSLFRFIFEPFAAYYYYIKNADTTQTVAFMVWFALIFAFMAFKPLRFVWKWLPLALSLAFAAAGVYYAVIFVPVYSVNKILLFNLMPAMFAMSGLWFVIWKLNGKTFQ